jgi:hypothetical protein
MAAKTHFKKAFNTPYIGSQDLPDYKDITLTIDKVVMQESKGLKENSTFNIVYFKEGGIKPMLLNATNSKVIKNLSGSPYIEDWSGVAITIYVQTGVKAFGSFHDALRIRPVTTAKTKPVMNTDHPKWDEVSLKVQEGVKIEQIRKHYTISDADFKLIDTK